MKKSAKKDAPQIEKFKETARAVGADRSEAAFDAKLKKIASAKPSTGKSDADKA